MQKAIDRMTKFQADITAQLKAVSSDLRSIREDTCDRLDKINEVLDAKARKSSTLGKVLEYAGLGAWLVAIVIALPLCDKIFSLLTAM